MINENETRRFIYESKSRGGLDPYLYVGGAVAGVAIAVAGFIFCVTRAPEHHPGALGLHAMTTFPIMMALSAASYAVVLFRTPRRIVLDIKGISLESPLKKQVISWEEVDHVETDSKTMLGHRGDVEILVLRDHNETKVAVLSDTVENFADLSERLQRIVTKRTGHGTVSAKARRSKRTAVFLLLGGVLALLGGIFVFCDAWNERTNRKLLESDGVDVDAKIVKHYMHNNIAPWVEYTFRDAKGRDFERRAMLDTAPWQALEGAKTVKARYIRSNPDYSRVEGEESSREHDPMAMLIMGPLVSLMSLLFFVGGIMRWHGVDLVFDDKTHRFRIKRLGPAQVASDRPAT